MDFHSRAWFLFILRTILELNPNVVANGKWDEIIVFMQQISEHLHVVTVLGTVIKVVNQQNSLLSGSFQSSGKRQPIGGMEWIVRQ